jgi:hypothetical protein
MLLAFAWLGVLLLTSTATEAKTISAADSRRDLVDAMTSKSSETWQMPLSRIAEELRKLTASLEKDAGAGLDAEAEKRGAWDMDYGWGGGRFGKRDVSSARYSRSVADVPEKKLA